ncbi:MAG: maleylpyruvate isomerase family mycothiol-dependent enzyme [Acidimicrobiales bacterium]
MPDAIHALRSSADRLADLVHPLDDTDIVRRAYPKEWTIADVMSHLGSGAVITLRRLQASLDNIEPPDDFNQRVWDEWNAKSPRVKSNDAMVVDAELMSALEATHPDDRARFKAAMGPLELDWDAFLGMRLNEHLIHEWDIAVTLDPTVALAADGTDIVVDNLELIARFTSRPDGDPRTIVTRTTQPERWFVATIEPSQVGFSSADRDGESDLSMPAESLIRLVYGRLDPDHTPTSVVGEVALLEQLRAVFPGP